MIKIKAFYTDYEYYMYMFLGDQFLGDITNLKLESVANCTYINSLVR